MRLLDPSPHTGAPTLARFTGVRAAWRSFRRRDSLDRPLLSQIWAWSAFIPNQNSFPWVQKVFLSEQSEPSSHGVVDWPRRASAAAGSLQARHDDDAQLRESAGQPGRTRVIQRGARASRTQRKRSPTQQESRQRASARARPPNESSRDPRVDGTDQLNPSSPNREETRERANRARQPHYHFTMGPEIKQEDPLDLSI